MDLSGGSVDGPYGPPQNSKKTIENKHWPLSYYDNWFVHAMTSLHRRMMIRDVTVYNKEYPSITKFYGAEWLEDIQRHKCNVGKCNKQSEYYLANSDGIESDNQQQQICSDHYNAFKDITMTAQRRWRKIS